MLETIREFAREQLEAGGEAPALRPRHRDWYLALAEKAAPHMHAAGQIAWLNRLEWEHENLRAALDWCAATPDGGEPGPRLRAALGWFWLTRAGVRGGPA